MDARRPIGYNRRVAQSARRGVWLLGACAALGAAALSVVRLPLDGRSHAVLVAESELHPALARDPLTRATLASPYTRAACVVGEGLAGVQRATGIDAEFAGSALSALLRVACAAAMFRLALSVCGSIEAAVLATLWFGLEAPLTPGAVPYGLTALDRSLGLLPLLFSVEACLLGRRNRALALLIVATYLHANPAIHLWPWVLAEDVWGARKNPTARRGVAARGLVALAAGLPLILSAGHSPLGETDPAHARAALASFGPYISGKGLVPADLIFGLGGLILALLALRRARGWAARPALSRGLALAVAALALGSTAAATGPGFPLWSVIVKAQPWVALYLIDLIGLLAISRDLAQALSERRLAAPAYAWTLALGGPRDWLARGLAIGLSVGASGSSRAEIGAAAAAAAAAAAGLAAAAFPSAARAALAALGFRGGVLSLPSLHWAGAEGLVAALALGWVSRRVPARLASAGGLLGAAVLWTASVALWPGAPEDPGLRALADWARVHLPENAIVYHAPIRSPDCVVWMSRARRRMTPCVEDIDGPMLYFSSAREMGVRLRAGGYDPDSVRDFRSHMNEMSRTLARATPARAAALAREAGVTNVLLPYAKAWPGRPLAVAGGWALYAAPQRRTRP